MFMQVTAIFLALTTVLAIPATHTLASPAAPSGFEQFQRNIPAPKTPFADGNLKRTTIEAFRGKVIVLNFWATWCAPCIVEMPSLERLANQLPIEKFAVIAISQDRGGASVAKPFLSRIGVTSLPLYYDPNRRLSRDLGVRGLPTTVIIAQDGTVIGKLEGIAEWDSTKMVEFLSSLTRN